MTTTPTKPAIKAQGDIAEGQPATTQPETAQPATTGQLAVIFTPELNEACLQS